jgi:hypothetical protein
MVVVEKLCSSNSITLGIRSRAPSSESRSAHPPPHSSTSVRSTGIRSREPTAAPRGSRLHVSSSRGWGPAFAAIAHVYLSHGHPFARAHCSILRCPPPAAAEHV